MKRRIRYPTPYSLGPLRLVTFRHRRGFAITDERGRCVWTTPHPVSGRPIPQLEPDARRALRIMAAIIDDRA
jgi:hypothetical protein